MMKHHNQKQFGKEKKKKNFYNIVYLLTQPDVIEAFSQLRILPLC